MGSFYSPFATRHFAYSIVPINPLAALMPLLRLDRKGGNRARVETLQRNRLAGLLAETVGAVLEPPQRGIDLGDQLALAVAGAKLELALGLGRGAVGEVGIGGGLGLEVLDGFPALAQDVL